MAKEKLLLLPFEGHFLGRPNPALLVSEYIDQAETPFETVCHPLPARQSTLNVIPADEAPEHLDGHYLKLDQTIRDAISQENPTHIMSTGVSLSRDSSTIEDGALGYMMYYPQGPRLSLDPEKPELVDVWLKSTVNTAKVLNACVAATLRLRRFDVRNIPSEVLQPTTCNAVGFYALSYLREENAASRARGELPLNRQACFVHVTACHDGSQENDYTQYPEYHETRKNIEAMGRNDMYTTDIRDLRINTLGVAYALMDRAIPPLEILYDAHDRWKARHTNA